MERGFNSTPHLQMRRSCSRITSRVRRSISNTKGWHFTLYTLLFGGTGMGVVTISIYYFCKREIVNAKDRGC